ncbi:MAG: PhnD/SsuA/transferrin family substrate-binding protein [Anaerolineae bacterium]
MIPLGSEANPLHLEIVAPDSSTRLVENAVTDLQQALLDDTEMNVVVELVESDAEALAALCDSSGGTIAAAWLSGLAYAAAYDQDCGTAALQVQRGERSSGSTGDTSLIIIRSALDVSGVGDLVDHVFCRLGYSDFYSWLVPSLMLRAGGITSAAQFSEVRDYDDPAAMIDDVASGDCDAAGIAASVYEDSASATARARVRTLQQSVEVPYLVLVVPSQLPLAQQDDLTNALVSIANGSRAGTLAPLLDQDQLFVVSDDELSSLRSFISRAGIDLAQAGT